MKVANFGSKMALLIAFVLTLTSCKDTGRDPINVEIPGVDGPYVQLLNDSMIVDMTFENVALEGYLRYDVPKFPNSSLEIEGVTGQEFGTKMTMTIDLDDIFDLEVGTLDPQKLPGGRNLPGVSGGSLPAVAFSIEKFPNMVFYVGPEVFGVFAPNNRSDLGGTMLTTRFYVKGQPAGNLTIVGPDQEGKNGGLLLMVNLDGQVGKFLRKRAKRY